MPARRPSLLIVKLVGALLSLGIVASNLVNFSHWSERRGVYDDICYLRQAHLFQRFGLAGVSTDITLDDDKFFANAQRDIGMQNWDDPAQAVCHVDMSMTGKRVLQYPPGPGFLLSLFPAGFQVVPLYSSATVLIGAMALVAIAIAVSVEAALVATGLGAMALYLMVNPTKSSYSLPPTMVICAVVGYLTTTMSASPKRLNRLIASAAAGLLIGLAVNFRIPNLLLSSGFAVVLGVTFLLRRNIETFLQGLVFAVTMLIGMMPTLIANAVNAGSPFRTTYGGADVSGPAFDAGVIWQYVTNLQGMLIALAIVGLSALVRRARGDRIWQALLIVACNLAINLAFFLSHPVYTPYYLMPVAMLSLWSLLFCYLTRIRLIAASPVPS